jgi:two-component system invasion response regulator UvrY
MIKILLVDDHAIVREGYRGLIAKQPDLTLIAEAENANQAYEHFKEFNPDVVVTDISLPTISGLELISRIKQRKQNAKILVFSMHQNSSYAIQATRAGALGYVTKSSSPETLLRGIREVYNGHYFLSPDIAQVLALEKIGNERTALEALTIREFEILRLLVEAKNTEEIANALNISQKTVCNCHYQIKNKLGVSNDIELTRLAIKLNVTNVTA